MTQQKGFAHAFLVIGLVVALAGTLGFICWQNFIHKEPIATKGEVIKMGSADKSTDDFQEAEISKAPLTKSALATALPSDCNLGISDESNDFDVTKLTKVTESSPSLGPLEYKQHGRVNEDQSWIYVAGGCGSNAGAFVLEDNAGKWKLAAYHTGDAWFDCKKIDGLDIPKQVVGLCLDGSNERTIR